MEALNRDGTKIFCPYPLRNENSSEVSPQSQQRLRAGQILCLCEPGKAPILQFALMYRRS